MAVMIISVLREVSSIWYPQTGKNGIGKMIRIQIAPSKRSIFHLSLSLERNSIAFWFYIHMKDKLFLVLFSGWMRVILKMNMLNRNSINKNSSYVSLSNLTLLFIPSAMLMVLKRRWNDHDINLKIDAFRFCYLWIITICVN
jgi:hypothetical protein